jgi:hypothetical protein
MPKPLMVVPSWVEAHCVIPDGDSRGEPFLLGDEQLVFVANHYLVKDSAELGEKASAFVFRRSQLVRAQKWGKSPLIAAFVCVEGVGPVLFDGWADSGDRYVCRDHGCGCGWVYEYEPGEPMGRPWATPLIQITATSEDQTDNTYGALRPMIELGPLAELIPHTGEEFIRLPGGGRIDVVTSKANSRLGQRVTFAPQDETGLWVKANGGHKLANTQRRGLAGMGGRAIETTNAWNPAEDSVAQRTFESPSTDINKDFRQPPANLSFGDKRERRKIFEFNYAGAPWVPIAQVEAEAAELLVKDRAEAERFFGNRIVAGDGTWVSEADWDAKADSTIVVKPRTKVCLGFDGSDNNDWTGIRLETLDLFQFTPTYLAGEDSRPAYWIPTEWGGRVPRLEVNAAVDHIMREFDVVRAYCDPMFWESEIDAWAGQYGERVFLKWHTNRVSQMHASLDRFRTDIRNTDSVFRHDGDEVVAQHVRNAVIRARPGEKYIIGKPSENQKIDFCMSSALAHEAALDSIAAGSGKQSEPDFIYF